MYALSYRNDTLLSMPSYIFWYFLLAMIVGLMSCKSSNHAMISSSSDLKFVSTGGTFRDGLFCANTPNDVVVPLQSLDKPPAPGDMHMSVEGIDRFIKTNNIKTINELLHKLPIDYKTNFSLIEKSQGSSKSSLEYPRVVLFGADGRVLINFGTDKQDPSYSKFNVAQLHEDTGQWEFSFFDFDGPRPRLKRNPDSCKSCHGQNLRPIWGTNLDWQGVFGDNVAAGPQGEALDTKHVIQLRKIRDGKAKTRRLDFLVFADQELHRGGKRKIAHHAFGADLFISNLAIGGATARGVFIRLKNHHPKLYLKLRDALVLLAYAQVEPRILTKQDRIHLRNRLIKYGVTEPSVDNIFSVLGVDVNEAFSLATLANQEPADPHWKLGSGTLYEVVLLQVLDDLAQDDPALYNRLKNAHPGHGVFGCPDLAKSIMDIVDLKMLYFFHLKGQSKFEVNQVFAPLDLEHINRTVFQPTVSVVGRYLKSKVLDSN